MIQQRNVFSTGLILSVSSALILSLHRCYVHVTFKRNTNRPNVQTQRASCSYLCDWHVHIRVVIKILQLNSYTIRIQSFNEF